MTVILMSRSEIDRMNVLRDLAKERIRVSEAAALLNLGRRQVFRLAKAFRRRGPAAATAQPAAAGLGGRDRLHQLGTDPTEVRPRPSGGVGIDLLLHLLEHRFRIGDILLAAAEGFELGVDAGERFRQRLADALVKLGAELDQLAELRFAAAELIDGDDVLLLLRGRAGQLHELPDRLLRLLAHFAERRIDHLFRRPVYQRGRIIEPDDQALADYPAEVDLSGHLRAVLTEPDPAERVNATVDAWLAHRYVPPIPYVTALAEAGRASLSHGLVSPAH